MRRVDVGRRISTGREKRTVSGTCASGVRRVARTALVPHSPRLVVRGRATNLRRNESVAEQQGVAAAPIRGEHGALLRGDARQVFGIGRNKTPGRRVYWRTERGPCRSNPVDTIHVGGIMNLKSIAIVSAVGSLLALGTVTAAAEDKEKCYGVAEKGKNDCSNAKHSCAGQATTDKA